MFDLYAPNGRQIVGTDDTVPACAAVSGFTRAEDGTFRPEYMGDTEVYWDGQETQVFDRTAYVLMDEDGRLWLDRECSPVPEERAALRRMISRLIHPAADETDVADARALLAEIEGEG